MRSVIVFSLIISILSFSAYAWGDSCDRCYVQIADGEKFCEACTLNSSRDLSEMKSKEEQIANSIKSSRESYKNALMELIQFYLNIGHHHRLQKARMELKALSKVPQSEYLYTRESVSDISPTKNIEVANILFEDGKNYKNIFNLSAGGKTNLSNAAVRFKKILDDYPESDKADDAAYELADISEGIDFKDYEGAVYYYVRCYELNPNTDRPARYMAARIYDKYLRDYKEAIRNYEMALKTCENKRLLRIANKRLDELRKQGY